MPQRRAFQPNPQQAATQAPHGPMRSPVQSQQMQAPAQPLPPGPTAGFGDRQAMQQDQQAQAQAQGPGPAGGAMPLPSSMPLQGGLPTPKPPTAGGTVDPLNATQFMTAQQPGSTLPQHQTAPQDRYAHESGTTALSGGQDLEMPDESGSGGGLNQSVLLKLLGTMGKL